MSPLGLGGVKGFFAEILLFQNSGQAPSLRCLQPRWRVVADDATTVPIYTFKMPLPATGRQTWTSKASSRGS